MGKEQVELVELKETARMRKIMRRKEIDAHRQGE